jgi:hypothetical protein
VLSNSSVLTCCKNAREHPALAIFNGFFVLEVFLKDFHAAHPFGRGSAPIEVITPVAHENTIVIRRINLAQSIQFKLFSDNEPTALAT